MSATATCPSGEITAGSLYTLDEIKSRLKLGTHALRMARRNGLPVRYVGRNGYISGKDLIAYVETSAKTEK